MPCNCKITGETKDPFQNLLFFITYSLRQQSDRNVSIKIICCRPVLKIIRKTVHPVCLVFLIDSLTLIVLLEFRCEFLWVT